MSKVLEFKDDLEDIAIEGIDKLEKQLIQLRDYVNKGELGSIDSDYYDLTNNTSALESVLSALVTTGFVANLAEEDYKAENESEAVEESVEPMVVTQPVDYVMGHLRYGHLRWDVPEYMEEEVRNMSTEELERWVREAGNVIVDDYSVEDFGELIGKPNITGGRN